MKKDTLRGLGAITGVTLIGLAACEGTGATDLIPGVGPNNGEAPKETSPTKESEIYTTTFRWLSSKDTTIQDLSEKIGIEPDAIGGYEIEIDGIISADGPRKMTLQFTHYHDNSGTFFAGMHTPQSPGGELMYYELIDKGDGVFVVHKGVQRNGDSKVVLEYPVSAMSDLRHGFETTINLFPPEEITAFLPSLAEGESLKVVVPAHPNVQVAEESLFPAFLNVNESSQETNVPPSEEFNAIQEQIAASGETFTLNANGQIEMQTEEGISIVPDIQIKPDGTMTITHEGQEFTANTDTLEINGQTIRFKDTEGKTWLFDGTSLKAEIREFVTPEVRDKFNEAGIDLKDLDIDQNGLHITVNGKTVDVPLSDLEKFTYQVNGVTGDIYQFQPVIDRETNSMVLYTFDTEAKTWKISETLEPVKISVDKNSPSSCTYMDVLSGNLARSIRENSTIVFPEDAVNKGWDYSSGATGNTAPIFLVNGSKNATQIVNICEIKDDFMDLQYKSFVVNVAILNPDNTTGIMNFFAYKKSSLEWLLDVLGGKKIGVAKEVPAQNLELWNDPIHGPFVRIYSAQGDKKIKFAIDTLQTSGNIPGDLEKMLVLGEGY